MRGFLRSFLQFCGCGLLVAVGLVFSSLPALSASSPLPYDVTCQTLPGTPAASLCYRQPAMSYPDWFLINNGRALPISFNTYGPNVSSLSFSPSGQLLAVITTGEGHPLLDLFDSSHLRENHDLVSLGSWDPYPGWVSIAGWDGETLLLEADVPLHQEYDRSVERDDSLTYTFRWSRAVPKLQLVNVVKR